MKVTKISIDDLLIVIHTGYPIALIDSITGDVSLRHTFSYSMPLKKSWFVNNEIPTHKLR